MEKRSVVCIPLRNISLVPDTTISIDVKRSFSVKAIDKALENGGEVFLLQQMLSSDDEPSAANMRKVGTIATIIDTATFPGTGLKAAVAGRSRARFLSWDLVDGVYIAEVEELEDIPYDENEMLMAGQMFSEELERLLKMSDKYPHEMVDDIKRERDTDKRINMYAHFLLSVDNGEYLECNSRLERYCLLIAKIRDEIEIVKVQKDIESVINDKMMHVNREYILREQRRAIDDELGDDEENEIEELHKSIDELLTSDEIKAKLHKEVVRMARLSPSTPEYAISRNYVEFILELPWGKLSSDSEDLNAVKAILDEDHYGLDKVKDRILEYLAVRILTHGKGKGTILCLVGPPGVGKTSIAKSIARALGKEYIQMSLGGIHDEAEIRGHRKTYVGAMPGRIISSLNKVKTNNPLFLLDEIDKLTSDMKGDPSSALLEVLDPEQNKAFRDNYIEIPYDLSKVMFITTANSLDTIQQALLDRMEIIEMSGYTELEKLNIAKNYLVAKQKKDSGVENITFTDGALLEIIRSYTREAGVRNLERAIGNICRKVARDIVESGDVDKSYKITKQNVSKYLGKIKYIDSEIVNGVGECTGLAWTSVGGDTLSIEVGIVDGKGEIILTGHLGDVMQESARTAVTCVKSRAKEFGVSAKFFENHDIHIHVPEGAVPKDGPSAGITMATAIMSAVTGRAVVNGIAMTGEITLRGNVLPIGGLKEKSLAAYRLGVKKILIPTKNVRDLEDIPEVVKKNIKFVPVDTIDVVFAESLGE